MIPSERKELACGSMEDCTGYVNSLPQEKRGTVEIVRNSGPGPEYSVFRKRVQVDPTIKTPLRRLSRFKVRVQGVTKEHNRPIWISLEPGDLISFCPRGTSQKVTVPISSLYNHARFIAARAIAIERARARKAKKGAK